MWCYFLNVGICSLRDLGLVSLLMFFVFLFFFCLFFFSLSLLEMSTVCCTKQPSKVFWIPPGTSEVIGQPVTQSVGNVCFMLLAECGELFAGAAEQHSAPEALWKWSGSQHQATALFQAFSCDVVIVVSSVPPDKEVPLHFKQLLNPIHISKALSL